MSKPGRNDPCPCGSGKKYKQCCMAGDASASTHRNAGLAWARNAAGLAQGHYQAGRLYEAKSLYAQILQSIPDHPDALHSLGLIALQEGNAALATNLIGRAAQVGQPDAAVFLSLGSAWGALGQTDKAIESWRQALALNPGFFEARINLGIALGQSGRLDEAVDCFRKAVAAHPRESGAHNNLGLALLNLGRFAEAQACFEKAVALAPGDAIAHNSLGNALQSQNRLDEAIASYQRAVAMLPGFAAAHHNLGGALRDSGFIEEAVASFEAALRVNPGSAETHNNLGTALQELGRLDEAAAALETATRLRPDLADAHFNLHALRLSQGDPDGALRCLQTAASMQPADTAFQFFLGLLLDYRGDAAAAGIHLDAAARGGAIDLARLNAWQYLKASGETPPQITGSTIDALKLGLAAATVDGLVLEFGVRHGASIRQIAALTTQPIHGFDSFQGLPENWHGESRGSYSTQGRMPAVPAHVSLHDGWFEDTLPAFVNAHAGPVRFMNVDCDLYSSTRTVLEALAGRIVPGTIIAFDEYIGHEHWRDDEYKAFQEAVATFGWRYDYLCFSFSSRQVVVRIR
jgi:tetratricopeptide (TPR) repeat protein